jgi:exosome complex exonuclease DIS3/RRP44
VDGLVPEEREKLVDLVVGGVDEAPPSERRAKRIYQEVRSAFNLTRTKLTNQYLPQDVLTAGVKSGRYFQGHYNANQYNYLEASLPISATYCLLTFRQLSGFNHSASRYC